MKKSKNTLQVFEWESLKIGQGNFTRAHFDALGLWQDKQEKPFFTIGHNKITFSQWVGVIQVGSLVIEVLPKAGNSDEGRDLQVTRWKNVLVQMLRKTKSLKLRTSENTDLSTRHQSIFDLYYQSFLEEVETLIHRGLVKKYRRDQRNRTALKGRLNFQMQVSRNLVHKERFYTEAFEYDRQNDWNEILLAALQVTSRQVQGGLIRAKSKNLELAFPDWPQRHFTAADFQRLKYDRKTEGYKKAIDLARLILLQLNPQIHSGQEKVMAILFDMNTLWEDWLLAMYRSTYRYSDESIKIIGKQVKPFWESSHGNKHIESDIIIEKNGEVIVLDAKWKRPKHNKPDDADIKQMFVYNTMWGSQEAWLVYPQINSRSQVDGSYSTAHTRFNTFNAGTLGMHYIDIFDENGRLIKELKLPEVTSVKA